MSERPENARAQAPGIGGPVDLAGIARCRKQQAGAIFMLAAVMIAAVVFGLGHLPQDWIAVGMIGLLGVGLGLILVFHRSLWDAVIAHGFFDAASFAMLYLLANLPPELLKRMGME